MENKMLNNSNRSEYLTIEEVAREFNLTVSWIRSAVFRRQIPYFKLGRLVRIKRTDFENWIEQKREVSIYP